MVHKRLKPASREWFVVRKKEAKERLEQHKEFLNQSYGVPKKALQGLIMSSKLAGELDAGFHWKVEHDQMNKIITKLKKKK